MYNITYILYIICYHTEQNISPGRPWCCGCRRCWSCAAGCRRRPWRWPCACGGGSSLNTLHYYCPSFFQRLATECQYNGPEVYLRRDSSGRVLSPGPGGWSRPSPAPEEWTHFISLSITPTPTLAILLCALEFLNFDFAIPSLLKGPANVFKL